MRNRIFFFLSIIIFVCTASCKKEAQPSYPNDRGELLADLEQATDPFMFSFLLGWSRDGSEIYYLAGAYRSSPATEAVYAFHLTRRTVRLVAQFPDGLDVPLQRSGQLGQSADGRRLYLTAGDHSHSNFRLYQIAAGEITVFDSTQGVQPIVSADGTLLGFPYRSDSIRLHYLATNTAVQISGSGLEAISPDGKQVLVHKAGSYQQQEVVTLADGSRHPVNTEVYPANQCCGSTLTPVWWGPAGLSLLYNMVEGSSSSITCYLRDLDRQTSVPLWTGLPRDRSLYNEATLSPDGRRAAFWAYDYLAPRPWKEPRTLYIVDLEKQRTDTVATLTPTTDYEDIRHSFSWILISPDNAQLVYSLGSKLYLKSIP